MLKDVSHRDLDPVHDGGSQVVAHGEAAREYAHCYEDALEVALRIEPDVPLFCFSETALARQYERFRDGFPGEVTYAVKANPSPEVIRALAGFGMDAFDVASPAEMDLVRTFCPQAALHYHNPVKSRAEIECAHRVYKVRHFAVDDAAEIAKIADSIEARHDIELVVRFRAAKNRAVCDFSTKFGADEDLATRLLQQAHDLGFKASLTFHPGSQCLDPISYVENIEAAARISRRAGLPLTRLNVGGGFPVAYPGQAVIPLSEFFRAIDTAARNAFGDDMPQLIAEPGRALVGGSTSLLGRVKHRRPGTDDLFLNDGIYGSLMEQTQVPVALPCRVIRDGQVLEGAAHDFVVYGPTCDPLDRIPGTVTLPASVAEGDWIEFGLVGAYGAATTTRFNGYGAVPSVNVQSVLTA